MKRLSQFLEGIPLGCPSEAGRAAVAKFLDNANVTFCLCHAAHGSPTSGSGKEPQRRQRRHSVEWDLRPTGLHQVIKIFYINRVLGMTINCVPACSGGTTADARAPAVGARGSWA